MSDYAAIMTTFNAEDTVERALNAILSQVVLPREIIIVDDCSSDSTVDIIRRITKKELRTTLVANKKNLGQSYSRNFAASKSTSANLVFFDDDDESRPDRTQEHLRHFESGAVMSFVSSSIKYDNGYRVACINADFSGQIPPQEMVERLLLGKGKVTSPPIYVPTSTCAINSEFFTLIGGFDVSLRRLEDVDLAIRATEFGAKISWSDRDCVERLSTSSSDKGSGIDMLYERQLITRNSTYLGLRISRKANLHSVTRELYFKGNFIKLFFHFVRHPIYFVKRVALSTRPIRRIRHDFKQRTKS
jgi:glycosyltransferase involved in cell wall biosynthesis